MRQLSYYLASPQHLWASKLGAGPNMDPQDWEAFQDTWWWEQGRPRTCPWARALHLVLSAYAAHEPNLSDHFSACLVFDRSCLNGSKRRSGLLIEKHSIHVANVQKHLRVGPWHERMSVSYIKAVWSNKKHVFPRSSLTRRVDTVNVHLLYTWCAFCLPVFLVDVYDLVSKLKHVWAIQNLFYFILCNIKYFI